MENPDEQKSGGEQDTAGAGQDTGTEDKAAKATPSKPAKPAKAAKAETKAPEIKPAETAKPAKAGRVCKEEVRWNKKTYAPGDKLPADVPAETIVRLEELGFV